MKLYHYTTPEGISGIINSKTLRLSNVWFLNDSKEQEYAKDRVIDAINCKSKQSEGWEKTLEQYWAPRVCVFCLSESSDSLEQWRGYGSGSGFAIEFDGDKIRKIVEECDEKILFEQVKYGLDANKDAIDKLVEKMGTSNEYQGIEKIFKAWDSNLEFAQLSAFTKHEAFANEKEWRFAKNVENISSSVSCYKVEYSGRYRAYYSLKLEGLLSAISGIIIGPGQDEKLTRQFTIELLLKNGMHAIDQSFIRASMVPYRNW